MRILFFVLLSISASSQSLWFSKGEPEYSAILSAYSSQGVIVEGREQNAQNVLIAELKNAGVWDKLDMFQVEYKGVVIDWKNLSRTITKISSPTSVLYQGFNWNGSSSYVQTGYNPSTDGVNFLLNSASLFVFIAKPPNPNHASIVELGARTTPFTQINIASAFFVLNSGAGSSFTIAPSQRHGWFSVDRNASNSVVSYRNGVQIDSQTTSSTSIPNSQLGWGARIDSGTPAGFSSTTSKICAAGGSMRSEQAAFSTAILNYIENSKPVPDYSAPYTLGKYGQSNANGKALVAGLPADLVSDIATNYEFYGTPVTNQWTDGGWDTQQVGVFQSGLFGVERRLLKSLSAHYGGEDLYLLNCGHDGTSLAQSWASGGTSYVNAIGKHGFAMAKIPEAAPMKFVVWMQGEADANNALFYPEYETRMADLIFRIRADYNLPNLVFILVSLSSTQTDLNATGLAAVNTAMQTCAANIDKVYYISQNAASDGTHYMGPGFETIAPLVYDAILSYN